MSRKPNKKRDRRTMVLSTAPSLLESTCASTVSTAATVTAYSRNSTSDKKKVHDVDIVHSEEEDSSECSSPVVCDSGDTPKSSYESNQTSQRDKPAQQKKMKTHQNATPSSDDASASSESSLRSARSRLSANSSVLVSCSGSTSQEESTPAKPRKRQFTSQERETIEMYVLKYRFSEYTFLQQWGTYLQAAGIQWDNPGYRLPRIEGEMPHPPKMRGAEMMEFLDRFALRPLLDPLETLGVPDCPVAAASTESEFVNGEITPELESYGQALRRLVVEEMVWALEREKSTTPQSNADCSSSGDEVNDIPTRQSETVVAVSSSRSKGPVARRLRSRSMATETSTTVFDSGAELVMKGRKAKRRKNDLGGSVNKTVPELEPLSARDCASKLEKKIGYTEVLKTENTFSDSFSEWRFFLSNMHSLLLFGVGSKRGVLSKFADTLDGDVVQIDAYHRDVGIDAILNLLVIQFLDGEEPLSHEDEIQNGSNKRSVLRRAERIGTELAKRAESLRQPLYLVLHSLDSPNLRCREVMDSIAALVEHGSITPSVSAIRLVASVDQINAMLLFSTTAQDKLNIVWKAVHTHRPFVEELKYGTEAGNMTKARSKKRRADANFVYNDEENSFLRVLASLSRRHTEVFKILTSLQMDARQEEVLHKDLFRACKHKCVVTTDGDLRSFLGELYDHKLLVRQRLQSDEVVRIPTSKQRLYEVIEAIADVQKPGTR